jgi:hypothetical protein
MICLCLHDWKTWRVILLPNMDGNIILDLPSDTIGFFYNFSSMISNLPFFLEYVTFTCILVMQRTLKTSLSNETSFIGKHMGYFVG